MNDIVTVSLADFGYRELDMAKDLLTAMIIDGLPDDFEEEGVVLAMNRYSGDVFLTNDEYQVAMLTDEGKLKSWYFLSYHGNEGFLADLIDEYHAGQVLPEDYEELANYAEYNGEYDVAEELRGKVEA